MLVRTVLLFSPVLIQAPTLFGENPPITAYGLVLAPFLAAILSLSMWRSKWNASWWTLLAAGYVGLLIIAAFRGAHTGTISWNTAALEAVQFSLLATLGAFAFLREPRDLQRARYLRALCWAPAMLLAVNVALHAAGYVVPDQPSTQQLPATMLGLLGVSAGRVTFPLSAGLNGIGPSAVAALVISVVFVLRGERRPLAIGGVLLSLYVILSIDSRGALLFAALTVAIIVLTPRARKRGLGWVAITLPILPILLVLALTSLAETDVGANLNRQGGEDIGTGTGRTVVWDAVLDVVKEPNLSNVWGYGQNGQVASGASLGYAYLFNDADPLAHSAHSLVLQTALDIGWLGVLGLIALAAAVIAKLARRADDPHYEALTGAALALLLLGLVQSDPTPVHPDSFAFWLLVMFAATRAVAGTPQAPITRSLTPRELEAVR